MKRHHKIMHRNFYSVFLSYCCQAGLKHKKKDFLKIINIKFKKDTLDLSTNRVKILEWKLDPLEADPSRANSTTDTNTHLISEIGDPLANLIYGRSERF